MTRPIMAAKILGLTSVSLNAKRVVRHNNLAEIATDSKQWPERVMNQFEFLRCAARSPFSP